MNTILGAVFCLIWIVGSIYLFSVGEVTQRSDFPVAKIDWDRGTRAAWYFNLFAILWVIAFLLSMEKFIVGAACSIWYFNQLPNNETAEAGKSPVAKAYYWAIRYHLGSLAFGSFLLAVIWAIRIMFEYALQQMNSSETISKNAVARMAINFLRCCLACFEKCIRFINKQAFIQIGLTGKNFCSAAKDGLFVTLSHPIEFGLLSGLATVFMWLGNALMVGLTLLTCFFIMDKTPAIETKVSSYFWPLLVSSLDIAHRHYLNVGG